MDTFEWTRIGGALCGALLFFLLLNWGTEIIYHGDDDYYEDYDGGELLICVGSNGSGQLDNNRVCPRGKGVGVLFPSYMMHRVTPVTRGTRKSLVLWVGGSPFK